MSASSRGVDSKAQSQNLLMRFRVIELKDLLRSIGQSTKGRKPELLQRSNDLLRDGSPKVQLKIREIWERGHGTKRPDNYQKMAQRYSPVKGAGQVPPTNHQYPNHGFKAPKAPYVIHPDVTFKANPFYVKLDTIIRPRALVSTNITSMGSYSMRLEEFHLTPLQIQKVYSSRTAQGEYNTQVVMRFCRYVVNCEQEDFLPNRCVVRINGQFLTMPSSAHNRPDHQRRCNPLDITHYIKTTPTHTNDITIMWQSDILNPHGFVTTVELVKTLSSSDLLSKLKSKGARHSEHTRLLVREKLSVDKDSEISATSLKVSLICPLGKLRITNPCRAVGCHHLQCFDASIYLQMNERKARWVCPVCDKPAPFDDLVIDGLFKEICESSPHNDIEFSADGSWHPISSKPTSTQFLSSPEKRSVRSSPVMIRDNPDDEYDVERDGGVGGVCGRGSREPTGPVVIDLTLSSSDEEDASEDHPTRRRRLSQRRRSSTSSTTSAESNEEREDPITAPYTLLNTSGCVSPIRSSVSPPATIMATPPRRAVARGASGNIASCLSPYDLSSNDSRDDGTTSSSQTAIAHPMLTNKEWLIASSLPILLPGVRFDSSSQNSTLQLLSMPQSSTSLKTTASKSLSSSASLSSVGQPVSVITSNRAPALPVPPYNHFQPSTSDFTADPFLPYFDDNLLRR